MIIEKDQNPPFEFTDKSDILTGIDIDIANLIAAKLNLELEIKKTEFDEIIPALVNQ